MRTKHRFNIADRYQNGNRDQFPLLIVQNIAFKNIGKQVFL